MHHFGCCDEEGLGRSNICTDTWSMIASHLCGDNTPAKGATIVSQRLDGTGCLWENLLEVSTSVGWAEGYRVRDEVGDFGRHLVDRPLRGVRTLLKSTGCLPESRLKARLCVLVFCGCCNVWSQPDSLSVETTDLFLELGDQSSQVSLTGVTSLCLRHWFPRGPLFPFLPFPVYRGDLHPLALCPFLHFQSQQSHHPNLFASCHLSDLDPPAFSL